MCSFSVTESEKNLQNPQYQSYKYPLPQSCHRSFFFFLWYIIFLHSVLPVLFVYLNSFACIKHYEQTSFLFGQIFILGKTLIKFIPNLIHPQTGLCSIPLYFHHLYFYWCVPSNFTNIIFYFHFINPYLLIYLGTV